MRYAIHCTQESTQSCVESIGNEIDNHLSLVDMFTAAFLIMVIFSETLTANIANSNAWRLFPCGNINMKTKNDKRQIVPRKRESLS